MPVVKHPVVVPAVQHLAKAVEKVEVEFFPAVPRIFDELRHIDSSGHRYAALAVFGKMPIDALAVIGI